MKLVPDWKNLHRWASTWAAIAIPAWAAMPDDLKDYIPEGIAPWLPAAWLVFFVLGRIKQQ